MARIYVSHSISPSIKEFIQNVQINIKHKQIPQEINMVVIVIKKVTILKL